MVAQGRSGFSLKEENQGWYHSSGQGDASSSPKGLMEKQELKEVNVRMITCEDMQQDNLIEGPEAPLMLPPPPSTQLVAFEGYWCCLKT